MHGHVVLKLQRADADVDAGDHGHIVIMMMTIMMVMMMIIMMMMMMMM